MVSSTSVDMTRSGVPCEESAETLAAGFKALGDPTRLRVLAVLTHGTRCVCEIQAAVEVPSNLLSHHLKVLREAGLITGSKRGRWIDYTLDQGALERLAAALPPEPSRLGIDLSVCADACVTARDDA